MNSFPGDFSLDGYKKKWDDRHNPSTEIRLQSVRAQIYYEFSMSIERDLEYFTADLTYYAGNTNLFPKPLTVEERFLLLTEILKSFRDVYIRSWDNSKKYGNLVTIYNIPDTACEFMIKLK